MAQFLMKCDTGLKKIELFLITISGFLVMFMMFFITLDVLMRTLLNSPITGVFEIVTMLLIVVMALGFAYVQGAKENIVIEILTDLFPRLIQNILILTGYIVGLFVVTVLAWQAWLQAVTALIGNQSAAGVLTIPLWPSKGLLAFGLTMLAIRLLLDVLMESFNLNDKKNIDAGNGKDVHDVV